MDRQRFFFFLLLSLSSLRPRAPALLSISISIDIDEHSTLTIHTVDALHVQMEDRIRWNDDTYHID